jgi:zinc/manganese transport system substrate-binding protein
MRPHSRSVLAITGIALAAIALAGCSAPATASKASGLAVVASTNVYGDLAATIGGDAVTVTSLISDPSQDPHSYEADAQVQLSLSKADVVIENGGGYDDFVDTMLNAAKNPGVVVLNAATISGYDQKPATGEFNEHLWYDFPTVQKVIAATAAAFTKADPDNASVFAANAAALTTKLGALESEEADIKATAAGAGAAITEPVPLYLLEASGISNKTPDAFSEAIEQGSDVSPTVLNDTLALFSNHEVKVLVYNEQTTGPETEAVLAAAKAADIAIVPVTETMPAGTNYIRWMTANLDAIKAAIS